MSDTRVLIVVFDALRPDLVTPDLMPNLTRFAAGGVRFSRSRAFFPTETRVNQTTVLTGCPPRRHGIVANRFLADDLAPGLVLNTGDDRALADAAARGRVVQAPMLGEILAGAGRSYASLSAGTPGGGRLIGLNAARDGQIRFAMRAPDRSVPSGLATDLQAAIGPMPDYALPATAWIDWAVRAYLDHVEPVHGPDVMLLWLCEPDESFHYLGIGSDGARQTMRNADAAFGRILERLAPQVEAGRMHIVAMSDHGQLSLDGAALDLPGQLTRAGIAASKSGMNGADCAVAVHTAGGIWVRDRDPDLTRRIVELLQGQPWCGPLFTAEPLPGTLGLNEILIDHARAPDIAVVLRAGDAPGPHGPAGLSAHDAPYPEGGGCHGGLSRFETNTFLAMAGAAVAGQGHCAAPVGNIDIAPTVLALLGVPGGDGMTGAPLQDRLQGQDEAVVRETVLRASPGPEGFRTCLAVTDSGGRRYLDEAWVEGAVARA